MLEPEVFSQRSVQHLDRDRHEDPALVGHRCSRARGPHVVVIRQIDVEDELSLLRSESSRAAFAFVRCSLRRVLRVHWTEINLARHILFHGGDEFAAILQGEPQH